MRELDCQVPALLADKICEATWGRRRASFGKQGRLQALKAVFEGASVAESARMTNTVGQNMSSQLRLMWRLLSSQLSKLGYAAPEASYRLREMRQQEQYCRVYAQALGLALQRPLPTKSPVTPLKRISYPVPGERTAAPVPAHALVTEVLQTSALGTVLRERNYLIITQSFLRGVRLSALPRYYDLSLSDCHLVVHSVLVDLLRYSKHLNSEFLSTDNPALLVNKLPQRDYVQHVVELLLPHSA